MLATRIIPTLLHRGDVLVKGQQFNSWRSVGHVQQAARIHAARGVDELCILDIGATPEARKPNYDLVQKLTDGNFTPVAIGGGIKTMADVERLLRAGADKVVLGTGAIEADIVREAAAIVGSQAVTVAIDYRDNCIWSHCGTARWRMTPKNFAMICAEDGAGEILLTCIEREGTMTGYDLETIQAVAGAVNIPVIAHGGCGEYDHMHQAIQAGANAVAAGAMFQFTDCTPKGAAQYLKTKGHEVRL